MKVAFHRKFRKQYNNLPKKIQRQFDERLALFLEGEDNALLNVHRLSGAQAHLASMNVTGDYRALFEVSKSNRIVFVKIGTHSKLYE